MERRDFFKLVGTASGGVLTGSCGKQARELIPILVPEQQILPGVEEWRPSVCRECGAGCGTIVRVMEAERDIELTGQKVRQRIAAIKKIEGNPLDPVSGGRLCARGQAAVQRLCHPDRLRGPQRRNGQRGQAAFAPASWDDALKSAAAMFERALASPSEIVFLTGPQAGSRSTTVASFLRALGAPPASTIGLCDFAVERKAAELAFGWNGLPVYEIQDADYVLSMGADFLGGWTSPVFYARRFGHMRQGRTGRRGRLAHGESRFSLTAGSADQWLPVRPGAEHALALAIGHVLVAEGLAGARDRIGASLRDAFAAVHFDEAAQMTGIAPERIRQVARELGAAEAGLVVAGASVVRANSLDAVVTANALNWLLGSVGRKGGVLPPAAAPSAIYGESRPRSQALAARLKSAQLVVLDGVDPLYAMPSGAAWLAQTPAVISFSSFVDDSSAYADLILPDHDPLEASAVVAPPVAPGPSLTGAPAFVKPLYDTRPAEEVLVDLAARLGRKIEAESPERAYRSLFAGEKPDENWTGVDEFTDYSIRQGGWWRETKEADRARAPASVPALAPVLFAGSEAEFPLIFEPYPSLQFGDGSGANLPWLQELPDPASSAMWGLPLEVDPQTGAKLGLVNGQMVRIVSPQGALEAPVYIHPAAIPGVVAMAIGQGHRHYGRYAAGRGANPMKLVAPAVEPETGAYAFGGTRVRIEKLERRAGLVQFSMMDREPDLDRR